MYNLINFISRFGTSAELRSLSHDALINEMQDAGLTQDEMQIILSGDQKDIVKQLNNAEDIVAAVIAVADPSDEEQAETKAA